MRMSAALFCLAIAVTAVIAQDALVPTLEMDWNTMDAGGGASEGAGFAFEGTIGQIDAASHNATMSGEGFEFYAGYWHGVQRYCPADVAPPPPPQGSGGDGLVNSADLLAILSHWGSSEYHYDIAPARGGDGIVNVLDLLMVIHAWGVCP
jgi:hypothetical protein